MTSAINFKDCTGASTHGVALELKLAGPDAAGDITGYGAVFGNVDLQGDIIAKGAFKATLAEHIAQQSMPVMLWAHDQSRVIGTWKRVVEDERGLIVTGKLNLDVQDGQEARSLLQSGALKGLSIGYAADPAFTSFDRATGARLLKSVKLYEISLVAIPANPKASILEAKSQGIDREVEAFLRERGLSKVAARTYIAGGKSALVNFNPQNIPSPLIAAVKAATAELERLKK